MKVLIGYDGSAYSNAIFEDLKYAGLPKKTQAIVLSVADVFLPAGNSGLADEPAYLRSKIENARKAPAQQVARARLWAETASKRLKKENAGWKISALAVADTPVWAILKKSWQWKPDLIVVGSKGRGAYGRLGNFGGVCQHVLSEAKCSVRVTRSPRRALKKKSAIRILVGVDGSVHADRAWKEILKRAWTRKVEVRLLTALHGNLWNMFHAESILKRAAERLRAGGFTVSWVIRKENASGVLLDEAMKWKPDSIFLGARGLNPVKQLLIGSVSSAVAAKALCTVEIVKK